MNKYKVTLTKSFSVTINARNSKDAKQFAEFFTGDVNDISTAEERELRDFEIEDIECVLNEAFDVEETEKWTN